MINSTPNGRTVRPRPNRPKVESKPGRPRRKFDCAYPFHREDCSLAFEHVRWIEVGEGVRGKSFSYRYRDDGGKVVWSKPDGADDLIFRLPEVLEAKAYGVTINWCEGEKDALALIGLGEVATSHHGGAGSSTAGQAEWLRGHRGLVNLFMDRDVDDKRGGNPGAYDVIKRYDQLRAVGLQPWQLRVARAQRGKDAADHVAAGLGFGDFVWMTDLDLSFARYRAEQTSRNSFWAAGYDAEPLRPGWGSRIRSVEDGGAS